MTDTDFLQGPQSDLFHQLVIVRISFQVYLWQHIVAMPIFFLQFCLFGIGLSSAGISLQIDVQQSSHLGVAPGVAHRGAT